MSNDESEPANQVRLRLPLCKIREAICGAEHESHPIHPAADHAQRHVALRRRSSHPRWLLLDVILVGITAAVETLLIISHGLVDRLWLYAPTLLVEAVALYFFTTSIWQWVSTYRS